MHREYRVPQEPSEAVVDVRSRIDALDDEDRAALTALFFEDVLAKGPAWLRDGDGIVRGVLCGPESLRTVSSPDEERHREAARAEVRASRPVEPSRS